MKTNIKECLKYLHEITSIPTASIENAIESSVLSQVLAIQALMGKVGPIGRRQLKKHKIKAPRCRNSLMIEQKGCDSYMDHFDNRIEILEIGCKVYGAERA